MGLPVTFSIVGLVVAVLIRVVTSLPTFDTAMDSPADGVGVDETYSAEAVQRVGNVFSDRYVLLIDEIASFQEDPDYQRAEARRQEMTDVGNFLIDVFGDLDKRLEGRLGELTGQVEGSQ